jgi:hypothetical protein
MADESRPGVFASLLQDFSPVPRVFLFFGFVVFLMGVPSGFTFQNRTLMIGVALLAAGIAGHYWPEIRTLEIWVDGERGHSEIRWGNLFLATSFSILCAAACRFAYFGH